MRHALFVAFHFPPEASSSGVLRTTKHVRYLPERGYRVSVITADPSAYEVTDASLEAQLPAGTRVVRTAFRNTKRHWSWRGMYPALLALPDVWVGWLPFAVRAGRALMREDPVDLVYSTSPHATAHLIAASLARRARVPWIADFRDPWFEDPPEPGAPNGLVFRNVNRWLERRTIGGASAVVTSTTQLRDMLRRRYPEEPATKIRAILNGYDEADFAGVAVAPASRGEKLRIVHAGSINAEFRDPRPLFASFARLVREGVLDAQSIELRFIGGGPFGDADGRAAGRCGRGVAGRRHVRPAGSLRTVAAGTRRRGRPAASASLGRHGEPRAGQALRVPAGAETYAGHGAGWGGHRSAGADRGRLRGGPSTCRGAGRGVALRSSRIGDRAGFRIALPTGAHCEGSIDAR